jgi:hypothetical protein
MTWWRTHANRKIKRKKIKWSSQLAFRNSTKSGRICRTGKSSHGFRNQKSFRNAVPLTSINIYGPMSNLLWPSSVKPFSIFCEIKHRSSAYISYLKSSGILALLDTKLPFTAVFWSFLSSLFPGLGVHELMNVHGCRGRVEAKRVHRLYH